MFRVVPGVSKPRNNVFRTYSQLIGLSDAFCAKYDLGEPLDNPFEPQNVKILTHGFCGSTCALFATHLHSVEKVETVVVGGVITQPQQQFFSFPGKRIALIACPSAALKCIRRRC